MPNIKLFTSESVSEGHPDKLADQISDSILDEMLRQDKRSRVAVETLLTRGLAVVAGEVSTEGYVEIADVVRDRINEVGYTHTDVGFDGNTTGVLIAIQKQSPDIAVGVDAGAKGDKPQGAGRPGHDVRLRLRRDQGADAAPDHPSPPAHGEIYGTAQSHKQR